MKSKILTTLLSCAALAALSATASAAVMTYTQTGVLSGSLGGTSFTNAAVTFSVTADTRNIIKRYLGPSVPEWSNAGVTTINIDGFAKATFDGPHHFGVYAYDRTFYAPNGAVGFGDLDYQSKTVDFLQSVEPSYSLATERTFTGTWTFGGLTNSTTLGDLILTGASGDATFTSVISVPESSALALLGLGAVGLVARRRRVG